MELAIIPIDKTIVVDGEGIQISNVDISWIPTDVWAVHWNSTTSKGEIEYNDGKPNAEITEIGIYQQAVTDHASEKTAVANAIEAARDHLQEVKNRRVSLLFESDFTQVRDITFTNDSDWVTYRQELRDLPAVISAANIDPKLLADDFNHSSWPISPL